jgi:transforming growth factor-beta-induced protein
MKYLSWMCMGLLAGQTLLGCSDDTDDGDGTTGGSAGTKSTAGAGGTNPVGTAGKAAGGQSGSAGTKSTAGSAGTAAEGGAGGAVNPATLDIVETAVAAGTFSQLAAALTKAGLVDTLKGDGPFTVFAPTDDAFDAFEEENPGVLASLSKEQLTGILTYHVVAGAAVASSALKDEQVFLTVSGSPVLIDTTGGVKVSDAKVTTADVKASNGVIHVIDKIILPPADDIVATAVAAGDFTKLAGALTDAGLVETLKGKGPFTVFAPTDAAFEKLAAVPTGDALKNVLLYHVVSGAVGSGDLSAGSVSTLLDGKDLTNSLTGGVKINDSTVTTANIITKNGVIHVIDTVLVPE